MMEPNPDYEKPEALNPQTYPEIYPDPSNQSPQPDGEPTLHGFNEPAALENKREFRGDIISSVISCLGEMTALMPVNAPVMEFPRRFVSRGVGFAVGWVYWFAYAVLAGEQLVAVSNAIKFRYDDGKTFINWEVGEIVDNAVWITVFLVLVVSFNMFPVRIFGELETTFTSVLFSYIGMDIVAATAAESRALADVESMKMAARKINLRVITLYSLTVLTASFVVPSDHPFINGKASSVSARSVFIIAAVEAGMPKVAHFFNTMFVFSAFTCAINSMYIATRVLHTLALRGQTGPEFITRRLRACRSGVPVRAVLITGALMMVAYMGRSENPSARLDELANNCTVSCLVVYATICATYLYFFRTLEDAKLYGNASESQAASYDRNHSLYPYKSHGQWLKGCYGMVACIILIFFNGVAAFIEPFNIRKFVSAYISHGLRFSDWWTDKSGDLSNTVQATSLRRKGRLEFPDNGVTRKNVSTFFTWVWVWMK
ncbi:hypothetical protein N0V88_006090 [Collariella sp. IMI 366227]|nr:hypothetical protein N0V88_006090 [Collariella sp. IMI 366227]